MRGTSDLSTNIRSILITSIMKVRLGHCDQHFSQSQHSQPLTGTLAAWQRGEWGATPAQDSWWSLSLGGNYSKMTDNGGNWGTRTLVRYSLSTSRSSTVSEGRDKQCVIKNKNFKTRWTSSWRQDEDLRCSQDDGREKNEDIRPTLWTRYRGEWGEFEVTYQTFELEQLLPSRSFLVFPLTLTLPGKGEFRKMIGPNKTYSGRPLYNKTQTGEVIFFEGEKFILDRISWVDSKTISGDSVPFVTTLMMGHSMVPSQVSRLTHHRWWFRGSYSRNGQDLSSLQVRVCYNEL